MKTYQLNGKTYLVHEDRLFVEAEPAGGGTPRVEDEAVSETAAPVKRKYKVRKVKKQKKEKPVKKQKNGKAPRKCKVCGEEGHDVRKCPERGGEGGRGQSSPAESQAEFDPVPKGKELSDDELREKIAEYRGQGYDSLWIAAKLRIRLKKVNELWSSDHPKVDSEEF